MMEDRSVNTHRLFERWTFVERDVLGAHYFHETESDRLRIFREEVVNRVNEVIVSCAPARASLDDKVVPLRKAQ